MVTRKSKNILIAFLALTFILLGFASACHCGDGSVNQIIEQCDDGNILSGDGCSSTCQTEQQLSCGDGVVNQANEECDWGLLNGFLCWASHGTSCNYCSSTCKLKTITNYCGDGIKQDCEECDDGNVLSGDGCSSVCEIEEPTCNHDVAVRYSYSNSYGTGIAIGNGDDNWIEGNPVNLSEGNYKIKYFIDNKKEADDNVHIVVKLDSVVLSEYSQLINSYHSKELDLDTSQTCGAHKISVQIESDGDECNLEDNYAEREIYVNCLEPPIPVCGNNIIEGSEQCDDGNLVNHDGCSATCQLEQNPPEPICGNSLIETGEECDDGNLINGDKCSSICKIEKEEENETSCLSHVHALTEFVQYCEPMWECSGWSECNNGIAQRKCTDASNCDFSYNKPSETIVCEQKVLIREEQGNQPNYILIGSLGLTLFLLIMLLILLKRR